MSSSTPFFFPFFLLIYSFTSMVHRLIYNIKRTLKIMEILGKLALDSALRRVFFISYFISLSFV